MTGFFGVGRSAVVFFGIDRDVAHFTFLERSLVRRVSSAGPFFGDAALPFGGFVFRDDIGDRADDRAGGDTSGDGLARAGAGRARDSSRGCASERTEEAGILLRCEAFTSSRRDCCGCQ